MSCVASPSATSTAATRRWSSSAGWPDWELPFIEWAEREGFEIGVCTNADLELHPEVLDGAHLYLSVGHDEYWSGAQRNNVEAARWFERAASAGYRARKRPTSAPISVASSWGSSSCSWSWCRC